MAHFLKRVFGQGSQPGAGPTGGGNSSVRTVDAIQNLGEVRPLFLVVPSECLVIREVIDHVSLSTYPNLLRL